MFKPEGVYAAMITPVDNQKRPDEEALRQYTESCIEGGVDGLFPIGSVGEFIHFSVEERKRVCDIVCDQAKGRVPVTPGVSDAKAEGCVELAQHARKMRCEGVVICPPYYYPFSQGSIERHIRTIAATVPGYPIILYNVPAFTSPISYGVFRTLSHLDSIVGLKDSSGSMVDLINYVDIVRLEGSDLNVLTGREETFLPALAAGAKGCMTACSGIIPETMSGIYHLYREGSFAKALRLQHSFLELLRTMLSLPFPMGFKLALEARGIPTGPSTQPLSQTEERSLECTKSKIKRLLRDVDDTTDSEA